MTKQYYLEKSIDNGGKTSYYDIPHDIKNLQQFFELNNYTLNQQLIFKFLCFIGKSTYQINTKKYLEILKNELQMFLEGIVFSTDNEEINKSKNKIIQELNKFDIDFTSKKFNHFKECQDFIDYFEMDFNIGTAFKVAFCFNRSRHSGTNEEREYFKIIYAIQAEINKLQKKIQLKI